MQLIFDIPSLKNQAKETLFFCLGFGFLHATQAVKIKFEIDKR